MIKRIDNAGQEIKFNPGRQEQKGTWYKTVDVGMNGIRWRYLRMFYEWMDSCNTPNNIHRDPGFLLLNPAPAATENFILKSAFAERHKYRWLPDDKLGLHQLSRPTPAA